MFLLCFSYWNCAPSPCVGQQYLRSSCKVMCQTPTCILFSAYAAVIRWVFRRQSKCLISFSHVYSKDSLTLFPWLKVGREVREGLSVFCFVYSEAMLVIPTAICHQSLKQGGKHFVHCLMLPYKSGRHCWSFKYLLLLVALTTAFSFSFQST